MRVWESGRKIDLATSVSVCIWIGQLSITHNPDRSLYNYFSISVQFFSPNGPSFLWSSRFTPQFRSFLGHFWGVVANFAFNKVVPPSIWTKPFRHGDAKVGEKGTATWWGCRIKQNWLQEPIEGTAYEQVPALICDTYACRILCAAPFGGVSLLSMSKITPPNIWGTNLKFFTEIVPPPW